MSKRLRLLRRIVAVLTAGICLLLMIQACDIYQKSLIRDDPSKPVYTYDYVIERFWRIAPALFVDLGAVALAVVWQIREGPETPRPAAIPPKAAKPSSPGRIRAARLVLLGAAIALVALGAMNGGARDVLVKAVNICTECIGLG